MATESGSQEALLDAIKRLEDRIDEQMTKIKRELVRKREQADESLVERMKLEKAPTFKRKSHEVQYHIIKDVKSKVDTAKAALQETSRCRES